jgi:ribosomal small subunit protein bTHX
MGKGDKRSRRGKLFKGSYGNTRLRGKNKKASSSTTVNKDKASKPAKKA